MSHFNSWKKQGFIVTMIKCLKMTALFCFLEKTMIIFLLHRFYQPVKTQNLVLIFVAIVAILRVWKIEIE